MDVKSSDAARLLADAGRDLMARTWSLRDVRAVASGGRSLVEVWQDVVQLGWLAALLPPERGGAGLRLVDVVELAVEIGAGLLPAPVLDVMAGALPGLLDQGNDDLVRRTLAGQAVPLPAARLIPYGSLATHLVFEDGTTAPVGRLEDAGSLDLTTPVARADVDSARHRAAAVVLHAASAVGGASRLLEMTVAHAGMRHQFGRPIGAFQALKHRLADLALLVERARVAAWHAAWRLDAPEATEAPSAALSVAVARAAALQAYESASAAALQIHGGIAFTWEHDVHLYVRRCRWLASQWGGAGASLEAVVDAAEMA